jgi:hypothetical protein
MLTAIATELVNHLKKHFAIMYRLFRALYTRKEDQPTQAEIDLARGNVPTDGDAAKAYLGKVESATGSILKGLERQAMKAHEKAHVFFLTSFPLSPLAH